MNSISRNNMEPAILLVCCLVALLASGINPSDRPTWVLEVFPVFIGVPILVATYPKCRLTPLLYRLLLVHALFLILGGYYTYSHVPLGEWARELFALQRNHFDRLGHFAQGFIPAVLVREILHRQVPSLQGRWLFFLVVCVCLAFSAAYEMVEWLTAMIAGDGAQAFLGTQGDVWDTHWDMLLALIGAIAALILLPRLHDRQLAALTIRED